MPKAITPERIARNINVFDFELDADQLTSIDALDRRAREQRRGEPHVSEPRRTTK